jgi:hypothetical protein
VPVLRRKPDEGRGPLAAPQGLAVLRQPAFDGGAIEGDPQLSIRRGAILLHIAPRVADQRRQRGVLFGLRLPVTRTSTVALRFEKPPSAPPRNDRTDRCRCLIQLDARQRRLRGRKQQ